MTTSIDRHSDSSWQPDPDARRPIPARELGPVQRFASWLVRRGASANAISVSSTVFALGAGAALAATPHLDGSALRLAWLAAAILMPLRLLANLFDGMVAIESGQASPVGELYNEVPDRLSDVIVMVGAGYAAASVPWVGWTAACLALFVAYIRALGAQAGAGHVFAGPMAKQQRMTTLAAGCLWCAATPLAWQPVLAGVGVVGWLLLLVAAGSALTAVRRLVLVARGLRSGDGTASDDRSNDEENRR